MKRLGLVELPVKALMTVEEVLTTTNWESALRELGPRGRKSPGKVRVYYTNMLVADLTSSPIKARFYEEKALLLLAKLLAEAGASVEAVEADGAAEATVKLPPDLAGELGVNALVLRVEGSRFTATLEHFLGPRKAEGIKAMNLVSQVYALLLDRQRRKGAGGG